MCPPATKMRPLAVRACPLQKRLKPAFGRRVLLPVAGSQSVGVSPAVYSGHQITFPSGVRWECVAGNPQLAKADHSPTVPGSVCADAAAANNRQPENQPPQARIRSPPSTADPEIWDAGFR